MSCHVCESLSAGDSEQLVYEDDDWVAFQVAAVPGWVTLATREHVEGADGLSASQADRLGGALRRLTGGLREVTGASRVHVVYLGESALHFHLALFPRRPEEPSLIGNDRIVAAVAEGADAEQAESLRKALREAIARD
jgi:diadenosine tetraphosphate (Ap4A) HIT family hydrolase